MVISVAFVGMVTVVLAQVTSLIVNNEALSSGLSEYVLVVYSYVLSTLILLPSSFISYRSSDLPPLNFSIIASFFLLGFVGSSGSLMGLAGLNYASATLNTAMLNLIPAFTFLLALLFRMEKLNWRSSSSQAKTAGTIVSITGAFIVTLYKGSALVPARLASNLSSNQFFFSANSLWVLGGLLLAAEAFLSSLWFIVQASILKKYPAPLIIAFFYCFFVTVQSALASLILVKDLNSWKLRPDIGLVAVLYSAIIGIAFRISLSIWCLQRTGPVYVSMFKPLAVVVADFIDVIFLGQALYLGSLVGAAVIITGFYAMMWGKAREEKLDGDGGKAGCSGSSAETVVPLLQNKTQSLLKKSPLRHGFSKNKDMFFK